MHDTTTTSARPPRPSRRRVPVPSRRTHPSVARVVLVTLASLPLVAAGVAAGATEPASGGSQPAQAAPTPAPDEEDDEDSLLDQLLPAGDEADDEDSAGNDEAPSEEGQEAQPAGEPAPQPAPAPAPEPGLQAAGEAGDPVAAPRPRRGAASAPLFSNDMPAASGSGGGEGGSLGDDVIQALAPDVAPPEQAGASASLSVPVPVTVGLLPDAVAARTGTLPQAPSLEALGLLGVLLLWYQRRARNRIRRRQEGLAFAGRVPSSGAASSSRAPAGRAEPEPAANRRRLWRRWRRATPAPVAVELHGLAATQDDDGSGPAA